MVEMMLRKMFKYMLSAVALCTVGTLCAQEVAPRIAGLEGNEEYMSLLREDARLQFREDSVTRVIEESRRLLREEPETRAERSQQILALESEVFEIRSAKGRLIDRINTIEQDWILSNLGSEPTPESEQPALHVRSGRVRYLVQSPYFREQLPQADYAALQQAQREEYAAAEDVQRYFENYRALADSVQAYEKVDNEQAATSLYEHCTVLQQLNRTLADSLSKRWNYIFDNKSYAYSYVLETLGREEALAREEELLAKATRRLAALKGRTESDEVVDYFLRKEVLLDYEVSVAEALGLDAARDSLRQAGVWLNGAEFQLPKIELRERYFLDYDSITFASTPRYTYKNPIPECPVYTNGTIYRILLGTFNTKRAVSTFRGAEPLFYLVNDEHKWCYYAGGFATREEAEAAQALLKEHGFLRPEVVVWVDGVYRNLARDPRPALSYRVEIAGLPALSDPVKEAIAATAGGRELSRVGQQLFVVGLFDDRAEAQRVADAVAQADNALEIKVAEIAQQTE